MSADLAPQETALEPGLPIIDAHHHVRDRPNDRYLFEDLRRDLAAGHNVRASVAIECGDMYRASGPAELKPLGEMEFLVGIAAMFASRKYGPTHACAGIVGYVDLRLGRHARGPLEALSAVSGGRLRGIRNPVAWHEDQRLMSRRMGTRGLMAEGPFREGVALLGKMNLVFDLWVFHPQLPEVLALARACPGTTLVLNHLGGPIASGPYAGQREAVFADWRAKLREVAQAPNVVCKLGGLGQESIGLEFDVRKRVPTSAELAHSWKPYIETAIEYFGSARCMFQSNFPTDNIACTYSAAWNAFKRITTGYAPQERSALFSGTAARVYRLTETLEA